MKRDLLEVLTAVSPPLDEDELWAHRSREATLARITGASPEAISHVRLATPPVRSTASVTDLASVRAERSATWNRPVARRATVGLAAAAAVAALTSTFLLSDPTAPPAYASWTPVPEAVAPVPPATDDGFGPTLWDGLTDLLDPYDGERWASQCTDLVGGGVIVEGLVQDREAAAAREVLVDRRGDFTYCIDIDWGADTVEQPFVALAGLNGPNVSTATSTVSDTGPGRPEADEVLVMSGEPTRHPPQDGESISDEVYQVFGVAGSDVTGLTVQLSNGTLITASLANSKWGLWWPADKGDPVGSTVTIQTATLDRTSTVSDLVWNLPE